MSGTPTPWTPWSPKDLAEFGRLDIVIANAGIIRVTDSDERRQTFRDIVEVNLVGAWNTVDAAIPALIAGGRGGSIVLTSSTQGIKASGTDRAGLQAYAASKRALVALMQGWAIQLAPHSIRVNTIHPSGVATDMILNEATMALAAANDPWLIAQQNALPIALVAAGADRRGGGVAGLRRRQVHHRHVVAARRGVHAARASRCPPTASTRRAVAAASRPASPPTSPAARTA